MELDFLLTETALGRKDLWSNPRGLWIWKVSKV
jgi:hypothetical protein